MKSTPFCGVPLTQREELLSFELMKQSVYSTTQSVSQYIIINNHRCTGLLVHSFDNDVGGDDQKYI